MWICGKIGPLLGSYDTDYERRTTNILSPRIAAFEICKITVWKPPTDG